MQGKDKKPKLVIGMLRVRAICTFISKSLKFIGVYCLFSCLNFFLNANPSIYTFVLWWKVVNFNKSTLLVSTRVISPSPQIPKDSLSFRFDVF